MATSPSARDGATFTPTMPPLMVANAISAMYHSIWRPFFGSCHTLRETSFCMRVGSCIDDNPMPMPAYNSARLKSSSMPSKPVKNGLAQ